MDKSIEFRIVKAREEEFLLNPDSIDTLNSGHRLSLDIGFDFNKGLNYLKCMVTAKLLPNENMNECSLKASASMLVEISPKSIENLCIDTDVVIPVGFLQQTASLTLGIIRGIIVSRMAAQNLDAWVLPPVKIGESINKPLVVNIK